MSYTSKYLELDVKPNYNQIGIPVGYEVEFRQQTEYYPVLYHLSTFQDNAIQNVFYYSLDNGATWLNYPLGETGKAFYDKYKIRVNISDAVQENLFVIVDQYLSRLSANAGKIIETYDTKISNISIVSIDDFQNYIYIYDNNTIYAFSTNDSIKFVRSLNLSSSALDIVIDGTRKIFWHVTETSIILKSLIDGSTIRTYLLGTTIIDSVKNFLNKKNGNLCLSANTAAGFKIFELDYNFSTIQSDTSANLILGLSYGDTGYFTVFGNQYVGQYASGILNETYIDTGYTSVVNISGESDSFYFVDSIDKKLIKFSIPYSIDWTFDVQHVTSSVLKSRKNDDSVIYSSSNLITCVRDNGIAMSFSGFSSNIFDFFIPNQTAPAHVVARFRATYGNAMDQSSSSTSESSQSSSSSTSLSESSSSTSLSSESSSSISESSLSVSESSSSQSSFGYSSSQSNSSSSTSDSSDSSSSSEIYSASSTSESSSSESSSSTSISSSSESSSSISESSSSMSESSSSTSISSESSSSSSIYDCCSLRISGTTSGSGKFGNDVGIDGDYVVAGANWLNGSRKGAIYIYNLTGLCEVDLGTNIPDPDSANFDYFGNEVDISGDYVISGAPEIGTGRNGKAWIFYRTGVNTWDSGTKIVASDAAAFDEFGYSVGIDGDYASVGAVSEDGAGSNRGSAYVYHRTGVNTWDAGVKLVASDAANSDSFGYSISISGDYVVVGAPNKFPGAAYVFHRTGTNTWDAGTKIVSPDSGYTSFGYSVDIDGDYIVVGSSSSTGTDASAWVFHRTGTNTWDAGTQLTGFSVTEWTLAFTNYPFVSISGDYVVVGGTSDGKIHICNRIGTNTWEYKFTYSKSELSFGSSVSIAGTEIIVGAPQENTNDGAIYIQNCHF